MHREDALTVMPIGGLGEIGMNMTLYGVGDEWFAVDAGVQFCDPWTIGAQQVLPDLDLLFEYRDRIKALILTHGHEDHIGAVEHVVRRLRVPVYAPPFACEVIRLKESEFGTIARPDLFTFQPGDVVSVGRMRVRFIKVTHSIPDAYALAIETPVGTVVHTGDFRIEEDPLYDPPFDREAFSRLGRSGVRLLLSDSTNILISGRSRPEKEALGAIEDIVRNAPGRVIVSLFASNVHRVLGLIEVAKRTGRRVAIAGRSLEVYLEAARRSNHAPSALDLVDSKHLDRVPGSRLLVICTGSQAEERSALHRASLQDHPDLVIQPHDTVILSSRIIPGHERQIYRMVNNLTRLGAKVFHERIAPVHASGHACRDELAEMIDLVKPSAFVPIHGEYSFLKAHADMAQDLGVPESRVIENGFVLEVTRDEMMVVDKVPLTFHYVDGPLVGNAEELRLEERRRIGWTGVVAAKVVLRRGRRRWKALVEVQGVGLPLMDGNLFEEAASAVASELEELPVEVPRREIEESVQATIRSFFRRKMERKPSVLVFLIISD